MSKYIVGLGEALWDELPEGRKIGGAPANFAYHISQLGFDSKIVSAVGNDPLGDELLQRFDERGLAYQIERVGYPTGRVAVDVDSYGIPLYNIQRDVAWDNIPFTPELESLAQQTQVAFFGSIAQRNEVSRSTINRFLDAMPNEADSYKIFDVNLRQHYYTKEILHSSMERCNVLKINDEELVALSRRLGYPGVDLKDKCWILLSKYKLDILILTCGINGSYIFAPGRVSFVATPKVEVADTIGAGDSFTAAFITSTLKGDDIRTAHNRAVELSAYTCKQHGAMPEIPERLRNR
ncbi:MAG: carbohydrate kinase [Rikenellaceae bacterium]